MDTLLCLRKEWLDVAKNSKLAALVLVAWAATAALSLRPVEQLSLDWAAAIIAVGITCQFLCDSLKNDFRDGGFLFLLNGGGGFLAPFAAKCLLATAAGAVPCLLAFFLGKGAVAASQLPLLLLTVLLASVLGWLLMVATGGADLFSFVLSLTGAVAASRGGLWATVAATVLCVFLCRRAWKSRRFRGSV